MDTTPELPEPAKAANPPERHYRELVELMEAFILEMELHEAKAGPTAFAGPETK
jgi:hypothetical protein